MRRRSTSNASTSRARDRVTSTSFASASSERGARIARAIAARAPAQAVTGYAITMAAGTPVAASSSVCDSGASSMYSGPASSTSGTYTAPATTRASIQHSTVADTMA